MVARATGICRRAFSGSPLPAGTEPAAIAAGLVLGALVTPWALVVPGGYLAAIAAGSVPAGKGLPLKARLQIPVALATMHMSWGYGFLTSPRSLARKVIASRRPAVLSAS